MEITLRVLLMLAGIPHALQGIGRELEHRATMDSYGVLGLNKMLQYVIME